MKFILKNFLKVDFTSIINHRDRTNCREYLVKFESLPNLRWMTVFELSKWPKALDMYLKKINNIIPDGCRLENCLCFNKKKTGGLLAGLTPCGIFISFSEIINGESLKKVFEEVLKVKSINTELKYIIYDKSCQLNEYRMKHYSDDKTTENLIFLIDSFHLGNHTRKICHENHNIKKHIELECINSQICEQSFRLISRHKHCCKHFSKNHFIFFFIWLFDKLNEFTISKI